jgi:5'-nucleotidase
VLSGINLGTNLGNATWHSGTLAAARQGALLGLRGIAFSTPISERLPEPDFAALTPWVRRTLELLLPEKDLPLVNVNLPPQPRGLCWTRQSFRHYDGQVVPLEDPYGRTVYWYKVIPIEQVEEGSDRWAVGAGYVSVTPLRLDLTDAAALENARTKIGCSKEGVIGA